MNTKSMWVRVGCPILFFAVCAIVLFPVFARRNSRPEHGRSCQSNLKQIGLAFTQYAQDYDGKYPMVMTSGESFGWADALQPYLKSTLIYRCAVLNVDNRQEVGPRAVGYTDYWYNERLQGIKDKALRFPAATLLSGEGNDGHDGTTARYSLNELPLEWLTDKNSPPNRHLGGSSYGFADGHVKWLLPQKIKPTMAGGGPTFSVQ